LWDFTTNRHLCQFFFVLFFSNEDILIGEYDAVNNDVPVSFDVRAFPSLYLRKADGIILKYTGERGVDDMKKYLHSNGIISEDFSHSYEEVILNDVMFCL
jgi:hypothetical protein